MWSGFDDPCYPSLIHQSGAVDCVGTFEMRQPTTFLLTVLLDEEEPAAIRGRARLVSTGEEVIFKTLEELGHFMWSAWREAEAIRIAEEQEARDCPG